MVNGGELKEKITRSKERSDTNKKSDVNYKMIKANEECNLLKEGNVTNEV